MTDKVTPLRPRSPASLESVSCPQSTSFMREVVSECPKVNTSPKFSDSLEISSFWKIADAVTDDFLARYRGRVDEASRIAATTPEMIRKWGPAGVSRPRTANFIAILCNDQIAFARFMTLTGRGNGRSAEREAAITNLERVIQAEQLLADADALLRKE